MVEVCLCFFHLDTLQNDAIVTSQCMHFFFFGGESYNLCCQPKISTIYVARELLGINTQVKCTDRGDRDDA